MSSCDLLIIKTTKPNQLCRIITEPMDPFQAILLLVNTIEKYKLDIALAFKIVAQLENRVLTLETELDALKKTGSDKLFDFTPSESMQKEFDELFRDIVQPYDLEETHGTNM